MTRYFCDRCKVEVDRENQLKSLYEFLNTKGAETPLPCLDLCFPCIRAVMARLRDDLVLGRASSADAIPDQTGCVTDGTIILRG